MFKKIIQYIKNIFNENKIYYINGNDTLPAPLAPEEERKQIKLLMSSDSKCRESARNILIEHNLRLVAYIAKKFDNTGIGSEDLVSIGTIGLVKAINTYKADKNIKIATYASKCIENEILMYIRKTSNQKAEVSIDEPLNTDTDGNELLLCDILGSDDDVNQGIEEEEDRKIIHKALEKLNERDREIIAKRYGFFGYKEMTQKDLADSLGISQSYISRLEKKIINKLKKTIIKM